MKRLTCSAAATAVALALTMAGSPADAAIDHRSPTTPDASARALPSREITVGWKQVGTSTRVRLKGRAQDLVDGRIYLQERRSGHWRQIATTKTDDATRYRFVTKVPKDGHHHKYRVKTVRDETYKSSFSQVLELYWT
jgi:hypothetical protein